MKKLYITVIAITTALIYFCLTVQAYGPEFDPVYYANKYPDVVAVFGTTDPEVLYKHYLDYGIKEGRYPSAAAEEKVRGYSTNLTGILDESIVPQEGYEKLTYVDVDIDKQIVTYFYLGKLEWQSYCVTGTTNGERDTPTGTFWIKVKVPGKRLKGPTWNCWVNRWMRFTDTAVGFHDATWRSNFGGQIYKTNGSHGCVNLPKSAACTLYDYVKVGTTVIVH